LKTILIICLSYPREFTDQSVGKSGLTLIFMMIVQYYDYVL